MTMLEVKRKFSGIWYKLNQLVGKGGDMGVAPSLTYLFMNVWG